jgi:cell division transport system ATP-binding protein
MSESILNLNEVAVFQKDSMVLNDITLEVKKGEFVYLIGKTGSGKSSLMKTLYADLPLLEGHGRIVGFNLKTLEEKDIPFLRRKLGIVFQDFKLLPDRNINKNLMFVLKATGWKDPVKMDTKIEEV